MSSQGFKCGFKAFGPLSQASRWNPLSPSGTAPAERSGHTAVWSDVADGMYVFGGYGRGKYGRGLGRQRATAEGAIGTCHGGTLRFWIPQLLRLL